MLPREAYFLFEDQDIINKGYTPSLRINKNKITEYLKSRKLVFEGTDTHIIIIKANATAGPNKNMTLLDILGAKVSLVNSFPASLKG